MSMTKKEFIFLADRMKAMKPEPPPKQGGDAYDHGFAAGELNQWRVMVENLAVRLKQEYPAFNKERWVDYIHGKCGQNGGAVKQ